MKTYPCPLSTPRLLQYGIIALTCVAAWSAALADAVYWTNTAGGVFSEPSNWLPNEVPGPADTVLFTNAGAFNFTVDAETTNASAWFYRGVVTQAIASAWVVTNDWCVGELAGSTSRVASIGGLLAVTNEFGSGSLSVGRYGAGEFAIVGGNVVTDLLIATNGSNSMLTLPYGSLTTRKGVTINNGTLLVGMATNVPLIWNLTGGNNQILNQGNGGYGGLTLSQSAVINLRGSNTSLTVHGLDTGGNNNLYIQDGASLRTHSVQLGLGSGTNNLVFISGPGSSWVNDYLMYFGMHAGAQTMIISNGGYFRTGGPTYSDMDFHGLSHPGTGSRIIVTGSNSWFHSDGGFNMGMIWGSPVVLLNNLVLVTNGGRFWARELNYGGAGSFPGNLIDIADGTFWAGVCNFAAGTLRIGLGTGTVDQINLSGGTNSILQTRGNLYIGHHGDLVPGELRIGATSTTIASLNGELQVGGWQLGAYAGDLGDVTVTGGRAFVTNASGTAVLMVGGAGAGTLRVKAGILQADSVNVGSSTGSSGAVILNGAGSMLATRDLAVGGGGAVVVSNAATLQIESCSAPTPSIAIIGAMLEFDSSPPPLPSNVIVMTNGIISFRGATIDQPDLNDAASLGRIQRSGPTALQLIQATNHLSSLLAFRDNDALTWSKLLFTGGTSLMDGGSILIETNSWLGATNSSVIIGSSFTNKGRLLADNSTVLFTGPVTLEPTTSLEGSRGLLRFMGGLHLPATDIVVPAGIALQASSITSEGGKLVITGGGVIPNEDGTIPGSWISIQGGWITYLDTPAAPIAPPLGISGHLGLELIRSTNAGLYSHTFGTASGGYERLRLGVGSAWRSDRLVVSEGGSMFLADPATSIVLTSGVFRVEQGGMFQDDSGGPSHVGFNLAVWNSSATVTGPGSRWVTTNTLTVGGNSVSNNLLVELGGSALAGSASLGLGSRNTIRLNGPGSSLYATNGLTIAGYYNSLLVETGAVFNGSQIALLSTANRPLVSLQGDGAVANVSQVVLSSQQAVLQVGAGASLFTSNLIMDSRFSGSLARVSDGGLLKLAGYLSISGSTLSTYPNQLVVTNDGTVVCPSLYLSSSSFSKSVVFVQSGSLFVTNAARSGNLAVNGPLTLANGLIRADKVTASSPGISAINLQAGRAEWLACDLAEGIPLLIGNGTNLATLNLLGGTNLCRSGLSVRRYSRLGGNGVITGAVTNSGSFWPSVVKINGNLILGSSSDVLFELAGPPGFPANSSLVVTGTVSLAGALEISVPPGTVLSNSQTFALMQCSSLSSNFANVAFGQRLLTTDRLGSFRIDSITNSIVASDYLPEDLDGDGIQDVWAMQHFGISPLLPGSGPTNLDGDWDGDGFSNRNEFEFGTDPNDATSGLFLLVESSASRILNIHFPYAAGRSYSMQLSENLAEWSDMPIEELWFDASGLAVWTDTLPQAAPNRFYRLAVH